MVASGLNPEESHCLGRGKLSLRLMAACGLLSLGPQGLQEVLAGQGSVTEVNKTIS